MLGPPLVRAQPVAMNSQQDGFQLVQRGGLTVHDLAALDNTAPGLELVECGFIQFFAIKPGNLQGRAAGIRFKETPGQTIAVNRAVFLPDLCFGNIDLPPACLNQRCKAHGEIFLAFAGGFDKIAIVMTHKHQAGILFFKADHHAALRGQHGVIGLDELCFRSETACQHHKWHKPGKNKRSGHIEHFPFLRVEPGALYSKTCGFCMTRPTLLILAKPPAMGVAKTRLAAGIGRTEARRIARFTLARTMQAADSPAWRTELHVTPSSALNETLGGLWPASIPRRAQAKGDLGMKLAHAMKTAPPGPVLFIGTDAPDISRRLLHEAVQALARHDAVFGPAEDGGFWLFGLNRRHRNPDVFADVRWSGPHAMEDVWSNLPRHANVKILPRLIDIDTRRDWQIYNQNKE